MPTVGYRHYVFWIVCWAAGLVQLVFMVVALLISGHSFFYERVEDWNVWQAFGGLGVAVTLMITLLGHLRAQWQLAQKLMRAGYHLKVFRRVQEVVVTVLDGAF
jgi:hypothetical protein